MPQPEELRGHLDSHVADIANILLVGRREGGMRSASIFLREFVRDSQRWAHLDIAGPAYTPTRVGLHTPAAAPASRSARSPIAEDIADGDVQKRLR